MAIDRLPRSQNRVDYLFALRQIVVQLVEEKKLIV